MDQQYDKIVGLVVPPFTPMHSDGSVDFEKIEIQAELVKKYQLAGVFLCGSTGESVLLTVSERMQIVEKWRQVIDPAVRFIVHVGHECLADAKKLAQHAREIGVDAIGSMGTTFFKPANVDELILWCSELAATVPELPFYYYHIPSMTGSNFSMSLFLQKSQHIIPNLVGIKFSSEKLADFGSCILFADQKYDMLYGCDELFLAGMAIGARGAIGTHYNYVAPLFQKIMVAFYDGRIEAAQKLQRVVLRFYEIYQKYGCNLGAAKAIMKIAGLDCGPVRSPVQNLSSEHEISLKNDIMNCGVAEYLVNLD